MIQEIATGNAVPDLGVIDPLNDMRQIAEAKIMERHSNDGLSEREKLDRAKRTLSKTLSQASRVIELVRHFRAVTAEHKGSSQEKIKASSIHDSLRQILKAMSYEFSFQNITILKILPHDLPPVRLAREHLETILFQLILHARQRIGNQSGVITVEAQERFYLSPDNPYRRRFEVRISNSGPALSLYDREHLFDPLRDTDENQTEGGFGLYIVKRLVELNGGMIRAENGEKGVSLYIDFPA